MVLVEVTTKILNTEILIVQFNLLRYNMSGRYLGFNLPTYLTYSCNLIVIIIY